MHRLVLAVALALPSSHGIAQCFDFSPPPPECIDPRPDEPDRPGVDGHAGITIVRIRGRGALIDDSTGIRCQGACVFPAARELVLRPVGEDGGVPEWRGCTSEDGGRCRVVPHGGVLHVRAVFPGDDLVRLRVTVSGMPQGFAADLLAGGDDGGQLAVGRCDAGCEHWFPRWTTVVLRVSPESEIWWPLGRCETEVRSGGALLCRMSLAGDTELRMVPPTGREARAAMRRIADLFDVRGAARSCPTPTVAPVATTRVGVGVNPPTIVTVPADRLDSVLIRPYGDGIPASQNTYQIGIAGSLAMRADWSRFHRVVAMWLVDEPAYRVGEGGPILPDSSIAPCPAVGMDGEASWYAGGHLNHGHHAVLLVEARKYGLYRRLATGPDRPWGAVVPVFEGGPWYFNLLPSVQGGMRGDCLDRMCTTLFRMLFFAPGEFGREVPDLSGPLLTVEGLPAEVSAVSMPPGVFCRASECAGEFLHGETVTVSLRDGSASSWEGCERWTATTCTVRMDGPKVVRPEIVSAGRPSVRIVKRLPPRGAVAHLVQASGMSCGQDCRELRVPAGEGETVRIRAVGGRFTGFSGCDEVSGPYCMVRVGAGGSTVVADFTGAATSFAPRPTNQDPRLAHPRHAPRPPRVDLRPPSRDGRSDGRGE
ncbi:MAG: hypothetical protein NZM07_09730 [Elioraea sp.]|nr:hypothetical protein [Elioraea sp.]